MGYGVALQASCLEGFDSLGLHQFSKVFIQQITKIQLLLENKTNTDLFLPRSYNGYYDRLSTGTKGFDPPTRRQYLKSTYCN